MLNAAKSSLTSCCVGFVRDRGAREAKKQKGFSHLPSASITFPEKKYRLTKRSFSLASPFQVISSPPPPPHSPPLGKIVRLLYFLASVRLNVHYLFIYAVTYIKWWGWAECFLPPLPYFALKFCFFPPYFFSEPILDTPSISVHTTVGTLIHVPSFQKQL